MEKEKYYYSSTSPIRSRLLVDPSKCDLHPLYRGDRAPVPFFHCRSLFSYVSFAPVSPAASLLPAQRCRRRTHVRPRPRHFFCPLVNAPPLPACYHPTRFGRRGASPPSKSGRLPQEASERCRIPARNRPGRPYGAAPDAAAASFVLLVQRRLPMSDLT